MKVLSLFYGGGHIIFYNARHWQFCISHGRSFMRLRAWQTGVAFVIALTLAGGVVKGEIPGADDPKAFTEHQYREAFEAFNRRTLVEAYKQVGHRDPKWDQPAIALLDQMSHSFAQAGASLQYRTDPALNVSEMQSSGQKAIDAGCDDPLVLDMYCVALQDGGKSEKAKSLVREAANRIVSSGYPKCRVASCIRRALQTVDHVKEYKLREKYEQMFYDAALATVKLTPYQGLDRRFIYQILADSFEDWMMDRKAAFCAALVADKADPWMTNLFNGIYHTRAAWGARGGGPASTVTERGWKLMRQQLELARACLTQAYALQPSYPEAATNMITVVMGEGETPQDTLRLWFDRAVKGQLDYNPAYTNFLYALLPRWHGSYDIMYDFGEECLQTGRYDTRLPGYYLEVLQTIYRDDGNSWAFWRRPGVLAKVQNMMSRYAEASRFPQVREALYAQVVGYAWQLGRYEVGRSILDKLNGRYNSAGLLAALVLPTRTISGIYAMTGPQAAMVKQAEQNVIAGKIPQAIMAYEKIAKALPPHDRQREWVLGRTQELRWQKQFEEGQWVSLIPDHQLAGWSVVAGDFQCDGQQFKGTRNALGAQLVCGVKFGQRWELTATVAIDPSDTSASAPDGGMLFYWCGFNQLEGLTVCPGRQKAFYQIGTGIEISPRKVGPVAKYHIWLFDGHVEVRIDDRNALPYNELGIVPSPDSRLAIGSIVKHSGGSFTISDLKIHKLSEPPARWQGKQLGQ